MVAASGGRESLGRPERLRRRADYQRCYREGRREHGRVLVLHVVENEVGHPRLGITASRKVGGAVVRHRLKRRTREVYRRWSRRTRLPPVDIVVHLKKGAATSGYDAYRGELERLLEAVVAAPRSGPSSPC